MFPLIGFSVVMGHVSVICMPGDFWLGAGHCRVYAVACQIPLGSLTKPWTWFKHVVHLSGLEVVVRFYHHKSLWSLLHLFRKARSFRKVWLALCVL